MAQRRGIEEITGILETGDFDSLIDTVEDVVLEVKGKPYQLSVSDIHRHELAKDVSALANSNGGVILIGFQTSKDPVTAVERIDLCRPFDLSLVDIDQYRKTLQDWIYPPVHSLDIRCYPSSSDRRKGVCAIVIPASAAEGKPYVVTRNVEPDGKVRGNQFGLYERIQDGIPLTSAESLRGYLSDGMRFAEISQRLSTIEGFLGNSSGPPAATGLSDLDIQERISEGEKAIERSASANIVLAAASTSQSAFPELFHSQSVPIVRLLENPPLLRKDGFAITLKDPQHSEIIKARVRRVAAKHVRLIDFWRDGAIVAVGPGDDDLLCWFTRSQTATRKPGLPIRNFVLAEVTLNFINLAVDVFQHAHPKPKQLKFLLTLDNMTEEGVPCTLASGRDNRPFLVNWGGRIGSAPDAVISSSFTASFEGIDVGVVAYQLLGELYVKFGFNYEEMPYILHGSDVNRITSESLFGEPWK